MSLATRSWRRGGCQSTETIILIVISMLSDPNDQSPANIDAAREWRLDYQGSFKKHVFHCVRKSQDAL